MRRHGLIGLGLVLVLVSACGNDAEVPTDAVSTEAVQSYPFGPFTIEANQEISDQCVQITLNNDEDVYVNTVELATGPGFHHSNWDFVPAGDPATGALPLWPGPDGVFTCDDRGFDQEIGAAKGGTLFAQSTQSQQTVQQFPAGVAIRVPAHSKLVAQLHLLNPGDTPITTTPVITLTEIPARTVTTTLSAMAFEDHALGLPPMKPSKFTVDCDLSAAWNMLYAQGNVASPTPDFHVYYALAHYHKLGTGLSLEAVAPDDSTSTMMFQTSSQIGDALGEQLLPTFDMTGYSRIRFSCDYYNDTADTVGWGIGNQEMCVFLAFTDSPYLWGGGALDDDPAGPATVVDNVWTYSHACSVYAIESSTQH